MTLVLQTSSDVHPESNHAISQTLKAWGLSSNGDSLTFGNRSFHYYTVDSTDNADQAITDLMKLPGVEAAYIKPDSMPPNK